MDQSGIFLVDKPAGLSSAQVIARLKKRLSIPRIGHAGTLDPMATGLLIVLVNGATRLADWAGHGKKTYRATLQFGTETSTDDKEGEIIREAGEIPTYPEVVGILSQFRGLIKQVPPFISAVKIDGKRAYKRARDGETFEIQEREVTVYRLESNPINEDSVEIVVDCSRGTYIRSLARDIGRALGSAAHLSALRREASHPFDLTEARELDQITKADLLPWDRILVDAPRLLLSEDESDRLRQGDERVLRGLEQAGKLPQEGPVIYLSQNTGRPLGVLKNGAEGWKFGVNF